MRSYWLVVGILGIWRIVHLLHAEDGPWSLLARLRRQAGAGFWGRLLDCFYCLSLWVAAPFAYCLGESWTDRLLLWPALSGGAMLMERLTARREELLPAIYTEDEERKEGEDVLRQEQDTISGKGSQPSASSTRAPGRGFATTHDSLSEHDL